MQFNYRIMFAILATMAITAFCIDVTEANAQERSDYVISAKAGGINHVSGDVTLTTKDLAGSRAVSTSDDLESGDRIRTGSSGRVEILLNPGSYLRLAENSEFELTDASLDSLRVKLYSGSAILELAGADEKIAPVEAFTPNAHMLIARRGVYRIDALQSDRTAVRVQKGRLSVNGEEYKDGKLITITQDRGVAVAKFDKKEQDGFDQWSASRAETLASANGRLSSETVSGLSSRYSNDLFRRRLRFGGYWLFDPFARSRTFLPLYSGWSSPYGHRYHRGFGFSNSGFGLFRRPSFRINTRIARRPVVIRHPMRHGGRRH